MTQYQSFPDAAGASRTLDKLKALLLPDFAGLRFLDIGCNEGFFCGFAAHRGAREAVGIDYSPLFIGRARQRFPACTFHVQGWDELPPGPFDVILIASALHYADDQPALLHRAAERLSTDGVQKVQTRAGHAAQAKIAFKGRGGRLDVQPLAMTGPVTVRLERSDGGACWESVYSVPTANDAVQFKAKSD